MIHPGTSGCEVYASLANALSKEFSCYGLDSYNLYHDEKIDNLYELSKYYLSCIDKIMINAENQTYHLLGWSLGGRIALEMGSILDAKNIHKIKIYLLDTVHYDDNLLSMVKDRNIEEQKTEYIDYAISEGYPESYINKAISCIDIESKFLKTKISSTLNNTNIVLFKAMLKDPKIKTKNDMNIFQYIYNLEFNNIDKIISKQHNVKLVKINDVHHENILDQEDLLVSEILREE
jgi:hypothetical protein